MLLDAKALALVVVLKLQGNAQKNGGYSIDTLQRDCTRMLRCIFIELFFSSFFKNFGYPTENINAIRYRKKGTYEQLLMC